MAVYIIQVIDRKSKDMKCLNFTYRGANILSKAIALLIRSKWKPRLPFL